MFTDNITANVGVLVTGRAHISRIQKRKTQIIRLKRANDSQEASKAKEEDAANSKTF